MLQRTQAISGLLFSVFALAHLTNQALASLGPQTYDGVQQRLRVAYQAPPIELALVLAPLLVHAGTGIARIVGRRRRRERPSAATRSRLHRWTGWLLLAVVFGHSLATRGASLFFGVFPQFEGVAFTLQWHPSIFWPYYALFALAALYHTVHGLGLALPQLGFRPGGTLRRPALLASVMGVGGAFLLAGLLAFGGAFFDVGHPEQSGYAQLLRRLGLAGSP